SLGERGHGDVADDADEVEREADDEHEHRESPAACAHQCASWDAVPPVPTATGHLVRREDGSPVRRTSLERDSLYPPSTSEGAPYRRASSATAPSDASPRTGLRRQSRRSNGVEVFAIRRSRAARSPPARAPPHRTPGLSAHGLVLTSRGRIALSICFGTS